MRLKFPLSLHQDVLWAYCAMQCVTYWHRNKEVRDIAKKKKAISKFKTNLRAKSSNENMFDLQERLFLTQSQNATRKWSIKARHKKTFVLGGNGKHFPKC